MKNRSLLWRIATRTFIVNGILLSLFFSGISAYIENYLGMKFDENLKNRANLLVTLVQYDDDKKGIDFNFSDEFMPEFERKINPLYFQLWSKDMKSFEKSNSLGEQNLSAVKQNSDGTILYSKNLPSGDAGRFIQIKFIPQIPTRSKMNEKTLHLDSMIFIVSEDLETLNSQVINVRFLLFICVVLVLLFITFFSFFTTRSGLIGLTKIIEQVKNLNADQLNSRVQLFESSKEVYELSKQFNSMLERIESSYNREKQFSSDVAHELKTPITELKAIAEIELRWPDKNELKMRVGDVLTLANHMGKTVNNLMSLARCESGNIYLEPEEIDLKQILRSCIEKHFHTADGTVNCCECELKSVPRVLTSKNEIKLILDNLLDNARKYNTPSYPVKISLFERREQTVIAISNHTNQLKQTDLNQVFDRMWQKKPERSDRNSSGLGLSLVQAYAKKLNVIVHVELSDNIFTIELTFPVLHLLDHNKRASH
jgi:two-component system sensor histidine kinase QseC